MRKQLLWQIRDWQGHIYVSGSRKGIGIASSTSGQEMRVACRVSRRATRAGLRTAPSRRAMQAPLCEEAFPCLYYSKRPRVSRKRCVFLNKGSDSWLHLEGKSVSGRCHSKAKIASYFAPLERLQSRQSIWQLSGMVCPPFDHGFMWSACISSSSKCQTPARQHRVRQHYCQIQVQATSDEPFCCNQRQSCT